MLDIRATHYVSPLSEVEFESIPLTVHITNVADETGMITGKFRVYNDTTGLLIHTSDIAPFSLAAGAAVDASALTDFDPPAPADDVYFVIFDGNASNALVPDGINFPLGAFYFDVKPVGMGPAPAVHAATHEEGGGDMIEVADMGTAELDDTLVLQPDGAGGVEWGAAAGGVTDHDLLNNLDYASAGHTGFAPTAHDHQGDDLKFAKVHPNADSTTALQILKANDSTVLVNIDSTNGRLGINTASPTHELDVIGSFTVKKAGTPTKYMSFRTSGSDVDVDSYNCSFYINYDDGAPNNVSIGPGFGGAGNVILIKSGTGFVTIGTDSGTAKLDVNSDIIRLRTAKTPASSGAAGNAGDICWDASYIYVCTATNNWERVAIATW